MRRALQIYGKTMLLLPPKKRFLVDVPRKTFNFLALYHFMHFLKEDGDGWVQVIINIIYNYHNKIQYSTIQDDVIDYNKSDYNITLNNTRQHIIVSHNTFIDLCYCCSLLLLVMIIVICCLM